MRRGNPTDFARARLEMVATQIERRGITDRRLLAALRKVPRHEFVPASEIDGAYVDSPLSIGHGQTISQPYIVAYMTKELGLTGKERILEIGTGSGYQTAILAELAEQVFTVEIVPELGSTARERLEKARYQNITFKISDGKVGWPEQAPFDGIVVTAAPESDPIHLAGQLKEQGRLLVPVGRLCQVLKRITRRGSRVATESLLAVRFVPLV